MPLAGTEQPRLLWYPWVHLQLPPFMAGGLEQRATETQIRIGAPDSVLGAWRALTAGGAEGSWGSAADSF